MIWPLVAMWLAHFGDIVSTYVGLAHGCHEMNPFFQVAGFPGLVGLKILFCLGISSIVCYTYYQRKETIAAWLQVSLAIFIGVSAVLWNLTQIPYCT